MTKNGAFPMFDVKGIPVAAVDLDFAGNFLAQYATKATGQYVTTGAHGIVESAYNTRIRAAHQTAFMVVPDGMPLVWLGKSLGFKSMIRVYGPDLMQFIFANEKHRALRHFFYGANPSVIAKLSQSLRARFGEFNLVGSCSPPMKPLGFSEEEDVLARIRELRPHFIWVGLSTPKQELRMAHAYAEDRLWHRRRRRGRVRLYLWNGCSGTPVDSAFLTRNSKLNLTNRHYTEKQISLRSTADPSNDIAIPPAMTQFR